MFFPRTCAATVGDEWRRIGGFVMIIMLRLSWLRVTKEWLGEQTRLQEARGHGKDRVF